MIKRFYWLKLKNNFFTDKRIKKLRKIAGGDTYTIIYLKMQLLSLENDGILKFEGVEPTFAEEIALEIDEDAENVKITVAFLQQNGLIEEIEENQYMLIETVQNIGSESSSAERVRKFRENKVQKALQCNTAVTKCNTEKEIENKSKEIEKKEENIYTANADGSDVQVLTFEETAFNKFWALYPKKINKKGCFKAFKRIKNLKTELPLILDAVERYKESKEWAKDNGQYIPYPQTFINQERWKDEKENTQDNIMNNIDLSTW